MRVTQTDRQGVPFRPFLPASTESRWTGMERRDNVTTCSRMMTQRDRSLENAGEIHFWQFGFRMSLSARRDVLNAWQT